MEQKEEYNNDLDDMDAYVDMATKQVIDLNFKSNQTDKIESNQSNQSNQPDQQRQTLVQKYKLKYLKAKKLYYSIK